MGRQGLVRSAVFFPVFFAVTFVLGIHFKAVGRPGYAKMLWIPVNAFAAFVAVVEVSWDGWEVFFERRETEDDGDDDEDERTLQPRGISTNFKVATLVMVSLFATVAVGYALWVYVVPPSVVEDTVPGFVRWYETHVLPVWQ